MLRLIINKSPIRMLASFCSILFFVSGCATNGPLVKKEVRQRIEHVAIIPAEFAPQMDYQPGHFSGGRGTKIAKGAGTGAVYGLVWPLAEGAFGLGPLDWITGLIWIAGLPIWLVGGAALGGYFGAKDYVPDEVQNQIQEAIDSELIKLDIEKTMAEHIYNVGDSMTFYNFIIFDGIGPTSHGQTPKYLALNLEDIDFIIEASVINLGFRGGTGPEPLISLFMELKVRAIDLMSGEELFSEEQVCSPEVKELSFWMRNDAQILHDSLDSCYHLLAEQSIKKLFIGP